MKSTTNSRLRSKTCPYAISIVSMQPDFKVCLTQGYHDNPDSEDESMSLSSDIDHNNTISHHSSSLSLQRRRLRERGSLPKSANLQCARNLIDVTPAVASSHIPHARTPRPSSFGILASLQVPAVTTGATFFGCYLRADSITLACLPSLVTFLAQHCKTQAMFLHAGETKVFLVRYVSSELARRPVYQNLRYLRSDVQQAGIQ